MRWRADLAQLAVIREFVAEASRSLDADEQAIRDLQLAVDEVCSNSIRHGYGGQEGQIEVFVERIGHSIRVVVRDWGMAFDPEQIPVPDLDLPLDSKGNSVTMVKRLDRGGKE